MTYLPELDDIRRAMCRVRIDELAARSGVCENTIGKIRSGKGKSPRYLTICKIVKALNEMGVEI